MIAIEASVLSADFLRLGEQAREAQEAGVDGIQVDVMDGRFVPNITFGQGIVKALRGVVSATLDVHLMIVEPDKYVEEFIEAGADRIFVHYEACTHLHEYGLVFCEGVCRGRRGAQPCYTSNCAGTTIGYGGHNPGNDGEPRVWRPGVYQRPTR